MYLSLSRQPLYADKLFFATTCIGAVVISFVIAAIISLAIEMPFINLDQLFLGKHFAPVLATTASNTFKGDVNINLDKSSESRANYERAAFHTKNNKKCI